MTEQQATEDRKDGERAAKIISATLTVGIILAMGAVHTCMSYQGTNTIGTRITRAIPHVSARPGDGRSCALTSKPKGAVVSSLRDEGREALGVTPLDVGQGNYKIRIEANGYNTSDVEVGVHDDACALHVELELVADGN